MKSNYYFSSFFWSTTSKVLTAIIGFISVPLLLGLWGKTNYGILSLAMACNGFISLLDLGMNTGAIKYYSQWKSEGRHDLVYRVAHSNTVFYLIISCVNIVILLFLAIFGEDLFNITHYQFLTLRSCLIIIAIFSVPTWLTTSYNQLLVADMQMAFTQKWQCATSLLKLILILITLKFNLQLPIYFFFLTMIVASIVIPYMIKCKHDRLIDNFNLKFYRKDFNIVIVYSLAIFALSLFQMTAMQSRPIILGFFSNNAADIAAEYRIIEVVPLFIIMVGGTLSGILLPKTSELIAKNNQKDIEYFAYKGTIITSVLANLLCMPFLLGSADILSAYVGKEYSNLSFWLIVWLVCILLQIHSTPTNALILAHGKTKLLVITSATACIISIIINAVLVNVYGVGSAVLGYFIYIIINLFGYYFLFYHKLLRLKKLEIFMSFFVPTIVSLISTIPVLVINFNNIIPKNINERIYFIILFAFKAFAWFIIYSILLRIFKIISIKNRKISTKYDK